jgi:hypothetical protein
MPKFRVLMRVDAYVDYEAEVEADDAKEAALLAYDGQPGIVWTEVGTQQFDARHCVTLDDDGDEIEETKWGKG